MKKKVSGATILFCAFSFIFNSAYAEEVFKNDPIIVTASRYETSVSKEGKDISVVTEDEIKKSGKKTVADVIESIPGVTVSRSGPDGGIISVSLRGSKTGNVLIMIDGVKVTDPMGVGNKVYNISGLMALNVERVEVVKGAMSSLYGAEASGGVINIITKKGSGKRIKITGEYGSNNTFAESVSASDSTEKSNFFISGSHYRTDGISKAKKNSAVSSCDDDEYQNITASAKMDTKIADTASVFLTMNYTDSEYDIDDGSNEDDPNRVYSNKLFTSRGELRHSPFTWWTYKGGVSYMSYTRDDVDQLDGIDTTENDVYQYKGTNTDADLVSIFNIMNFNILTMGFEVLDESGSSSSAYNYLGTNYVSVFDEKSVLTKSFFVHDALSIAEIINLTGGARIDDHEVFGTHWTWDVSASVIIPFTGTELKASAGTGFRAPSMYELYDSYAGNDELDPEKSFVYDAGIYQEFFSGLFSVDCTYFVQKYEDMIDYNYTTWKYYNADGRLENRGVEVESCLKFAEIFKATYSYTYIDYIETNDSTILKRPAHKHVVSITLTPVSAVNITGAYLYVDQRYDYLSSTENIRLHSYHRLDMNIRCALSEAITLTARGENLTDEDYEETYGYNTKGRSLYSGVEITL